VTMSSTVKLNSHALYEILQRTDSNNGISNQIILFFYINI